MVGWLVWRCMDGWSAYLEHLRRREMEREGKRRGREGEGEGEWLVVVWVYCVGAGI